MSDTGTKNKSELFLTLISFFIVKCSSDQQAEARTIGSIIRRRTCDEKVGVRKAALQV